MRNVGRISDWQDDKGYGFVVSKDDGARAFVHVKAFQWGSRRPVDGDLISYSKSIDSRSRTNAIDIRFAGQRIKQKQKPPRNFPRAAIGIGWLLGAAVGAVLGKLPVIIPLGYIALSFISWISYMFDKGAARRSAQRTPENTLHFVDLLGGWPGALIAQQQSRHKTMKRSFQTVFWFTILANIAAAIVFVGSGTAQSFMETLLGH